MIVIIQALHKWYMSMTVEEQTELVWSVYLVFWKKMPYLMTVMHLLLIHALFF